MEKTYQRLVIKLIGSILLPITLFMSFDTHAQNIRLISDEETEQLIADIAKPLFASANIPFNRNELHIVEDDSLNAFVADGNNLFIHTGTILAADNVDELVGVIAHEIGHIAGGHILRQKLQNKILQDVSLASAILAGTAAAASGRADVAMAAMLGGQSSVLHQYTRYRTEEERAADETALMLLQKNKQNPKGMLVFMKKIAAQNRLQGIEEAPYFRTHPITQERISFFEAASANTITSSENKLNESFARIKAKLSAYLLDPKQTMRKYPTSNKSIAACYARSIAYFKQMDLRRAEEELSRLIYMEPDNPYFHELKGQIYLETGQVKQAKAEYKKAIELMPASSLLQISYAQAILESNPSIEETNLAITILNQAIINRPSSFAWLLLARAYGAQNNMAAANYASAEYSLRIGAIDVAMEQIKKAKAAYPKKNLLLKVSDLEARIKSLKR